MSEPRCPNCGNHIDDAAVATYCPYCGMDLGKHGIPVVGTGEQAVNPFIPVNQPANQSVNPFAPGSQFAQDAQGYFSTAPIAGYDVIGTYVAQDGNKTGHLRLHGDRIAFISGNADIIIMLAQVGTAEYDNKKHTLIITKQSEDVYVFKAINAKAFAFKINQLLRNPKHALAGKGYVVMRSRSREGWAYLGGGLACFSFAALGLVSLVFLILMVLLVPIGIVMVSYGGKLIHEANYASK